MYKVTVQNPCSCFIKRGFVDTQEFQTQEEAKAEAEYMLKEMQNTFCKKHKFQLIEQFGDYTILIQPNR